MNTPTDNAVGCLRLLTNGKRAGVRRAKRLSSRIDMTPMVDLGFLLITFFVMTAKMTEARVVDLNMPKEGMNMPVPESGSFTILINGPDELYVYTGAAADLKEKGQFRKTSFANKGGLRDMMQERQRYLDKSGFKEGRKGLVLIIKPSANASYKQIIDVMDETLINGVEKHVMVSYTPEDRALVEKFANW